MQAPSGGNNSGSGGGNRDGQYGVFPWMSNYQGSTYGSTIAENARGDNSGSSSASGAGIRGGSISYQPPLSSSSSSAPPPTVSSPSVGSTGVKGSSSGSNITTRLTSDTPPPPSSIDTSSNARQTTSASSQSTSSSSTGLLDFDKMFDYQKRINKELDMPTLRETNREGYGYRKMEGDDQMGRDTSARRDAAALAMQRDVLSSDLERGTMRQQQSLQTRTKDQDLARAMSITMKGRR